MDEDDSDWTISSLFTTNGIKIATNLSMDPEDLIDEEDLEEGGPDYEDFEGWTGNEGANTTHYYHCSCIVMFPKEARHELLADASSVKLEEWAKLAFHDLHLAENSPSPSLIAEFAPISSKAQGRQDNVRTEVNCWLILNTRTKICPRIQCCSCDVC